MLLDLLAYYPQAWQSCRWQKRAIPDPEDFSPFSLRTQPSKGHSSQDRKTFYQSIRQAMLSIAPVLLPLHSLKVPQVILKSFPLGPFLHAEAHFSPGSPDT